VYDFYVNDQWRLTPRISLSLGLRWDYQAPSTELYGRLATIDVPGNFQIPLSVYNNLPPQTGLAVVAGQTGPVTGTKYSNSMLNGQKTDISPRIGLAWKPFAKHSSLIRAESACTTTLGLLQSDLPVGFATPFATAFNLTNTCGANVQMLSVCRLFSNSAASAAFPPPPPTPSTRISGWGIPPTGNWRCSKT